MQQIKEFFKTVSMKRMFCLINTSYIMKLIEKCALNLLHADFLKV